VSALRSFDRARGVAGWALPWARHAAEQARAPRFSGTRHLMFALCDHYEPLWGDASRELGDQRVRSWLERYPELCSEFRDADGKPPRHSFFFPGEQYERAWLDALASLSARGLGEVELHLHHDADTAERLRRDIDQFCSAYVEHGHLTRDASGRARFGFIHGNWCLANARRDGRWCGVDQEIPLLHEAGCYADFTFPSAPDECQPQIVNQIYWPTGQLERARSYEQGERARVGLRFDDRILIVQGPLALWKKPGRWTPRIENGALTGNDPATRERVRSWVAQNIHVAGRPDWVFVKAHTHGAPEQTADSLLGDGGRALHRELQRYNDGERWKLHYVSARELYNIAMAAMDGKEGAPSEHRDYMLSPPPVSS
jgi:hypothetical protein